MNLATPRQSTFYHLDRDAPLGAQDQVLTQRLPEITLGPVAPVEGDDGSKQNRDAARPAPGPSAEPLPRLGKIVPDEVVAAAGLELLVDAPRRRQAASHARYRVTVRNSSEQSVEGILIRCEFDTPLVFTGSDLRTVVHRIERLLPGEAKDLELSLYCAELGSHCCRFSVATGESGKEVEVASKSVCVEFVTRQLNIEMLGPTHRTEGSRAEFNLGVSNRSVRTLSGVRAVLTFDQALVPREVSAGARSEPGRLSWDLGTMQPMEMIQLQVDFECHAPARRACVNLEVQTAEISPEQDEACVEIVPLPGTLDLRLIDRDDPLEVGKRGTYEVTVHNIGLQPARRIALEVVVPEQLKVVACTVREGETELQARYQQEGGQLSFDPIDELPASGRVTYLIEVEALRAGAAEMRARLTSSLSSTPVSTSEPTLFVEP